MNQLFQNGFFSFEVVSSQEIASNNTCYLTSACTRCMRHALSFVTFFIFYLLSLEHAMWQLRFDVYVTFYLAMQLSPHYHWRPERGGKLDQALWKSWHRQIRGRIWPMFSQQKVSHRKCSTQLKSLWLPLLRTNEDQNHYFLKFIVFILSLCRKVDIRRSYII